MIEQVVFFNHWHYGDLFSTRGLVFDILRQTPNCRHFYIHPKHPKVTQDVSLPFTQEGDILKSFHMGDRLAIGEDRKTIFINTWVGAYGSDNLWENKHPSYLAHYKIFEQCYKLLKEHFDLEFTLETDVWNYIPQISFSSFDLTKADTFLKDTKGFIYLFCNNDVHSEQSSMGDMHEIINIMAFKHPKDTFIVTKRIETVQPNIFFTEDIFQEENDLIEIAYLSHFCNMIIGKNSSPFTYTNTVQNLKNPNQTFVCFSHTVEDTLPFGLDFDAKFVFSDQTATKESLEVLEQTRRLTGK